MKTTVNITPKGIAIETDDMLINIESKSSSLEKVEDLFKGILQMDREPASDHLKAFAKNEPPKINVPENPNKGKNHYSKIKICANCGKEFTAKVPVQKFCSEACGMKPKTNSEKIHRKLKTKKITPEHKAELEKILQENKKTETNIEKTAEVEMYDPSVDPMFNKKINKY